MRLAIAVAMAVLWAALNRTSAVFEVRPGLAFFFPAAALTVIAATTLRWFGVAAVVAGSLLSPWGEAVGPTKGVLFAISVGVWAAILAAYPHHDGSTRSRLRRFVILGVLAGSMVSALTGALLVTWFAGPRTWTAYSMAVTFWWIPDLTAALSFGLPVLIVVSPRLFLEGADLGLWRQWSRNSRALLVTAVLAVSGGGAVVGAARVFDAPVHWFVVLLLPAVVIASLRGGVGAGIVASGLVSAIYVGLALATHGGEGDALVVTLSSTYANLVLFFCFGVLGGLLAGENARLVSHVRHQGEALSRGLEETVEVLAAAIEAKENGSHGHVERVARLGVLVGREMGLGEEELAVVRRAAVLHDVGKIGIPESLLNKTASLEVSERVALGRHVELGVSMLEKVKFLHPVLAIVRYQQERWDGKQEGPYPGVYGLKGDEIPLGSRILAVVEAFDAMTHDRPYRVALGRHGAIAELWRCSGGQFDPDAVAALTRVVGQQWDVAQDGRTSMAQG